MPLYKQILYILWILILFGSCAQKRERPVIGISFETLQTEYWVASVEAVKAECERMGYDFIVAVANGDANRQFEQINNFISLGVSGIVIAPKDSHTVIPIIKAANRAGIPIAVYNRVPAKNTGEYVTVVADNLEISRNTVTYMCELAKASGKKHKALVVLGDLGDINAVNRREGFNQAVKAYPETIEVVAEVPSEWNQEKALSGVTNALQANPDISFIFTSSDFLFPAIVSAMKSADKYYPIGHPKHVVFGGFDGDAMAYRLLKEGYLDADGVQDVFYECEASVQAVIERLAGKSVETTIVDPGFVIHQDNFDEMSSKMWGASF
ncbi:MAG: sugar ABC transporter substrate-binding protein [Cyclobacteriaceae bacterium]|nr:MAG: sugar ABC transporter substrate-binding protein [Cyclobacteriaceae bacterium]